MIEFQKVTATYKKDVGVFDISFQVDAGEMVFLMGPTGAGKSTVLKAIYRGMEINKGEILIEGENISELSRYKIPKIRQKIIMKPHSNILEQKDACLNQIFR